MYLLEIQHTSFNTSSIVNFFEISPSQICRNINKQFNPERSFLIYTFVANLFQTKYFCRREQIALQVIFNLVM